MTDNDLKSFVEALRSQYLEAYNALVALIDHCPDEMWAEPHNGFPMAQQLLHPICDSIYYLRHVGGSAARNQPIVARSDVLQPDLERVATEVLSKDELRALARAHRPEIDLWFDSLAERGLEE